VSQFDQRRFEEKIEPMLALGQEIAHTFASKRDGE
jgi:hypothetical protein